MCPALTVLPRTAARSGSVERKTKETEVSVKITIDGSGKCDAKTPVPFLNHMLDVRSHLVKRHHIYEHLIPPDLHLEGPDCSRYA